MCWYQTVSARNKPVNYCPSSCCVISASSEHSGSHVIVIDAPRFFVLRPCVMSIRLISLLSSCGCTPFGFDLYHVSRMFILHNNRVFYFKKSTKRKSTRSDFFPLSSDDHFVYGHTSVPFCLEGGGLRYKKGKKYDN